MAEPFGGRLSRRLNRILLMLPYAIQNPGVTIDELAERFGADKDDVVEDLQLVFFCGLPGYGPGDLIDVTIDEEHVFVDMADYFGSPLRLTPAEALALYAGGAAVLATPGMEQADALERALDKLGKALGAPEAGVEPGIDVRLDGGPAQHMEVLQRAIADRKRLRLEYFSASRGELTERDVDPWGLIATLGHWYLVGWDHLTEDERMFRVDRIKAATGLDADAEIPDDFDPGRYEAAFRGREHQDRVAFEISPEAAGWFQEAYPVVSASSIDDGWTRVELLTGGRRWAETLVLRLGRDVRAIEPAEVLDGARALAERIVSRHSG